MRWEDLDSEVQAKLKAHVLDVVGVICAGLGTEHGLAAERGARAWGSDAQSTVVGRGTKLPASSAAFVNAFHARAHTYDDTYEEGPTHPGCSAVSAALACAELAQASGRDFLAAVLAGYEVTTRVSASVAPHHYNHGFHTTGTCNTFGASAAACRAFGLGPEETVSGFGFAGEAAAGLRQYQVAGSMADTAFDGARAAQSGVMVAQLAMAGLPGTKGILDGPLGYCRVMSPECDVERLDRDLSTRYEFLDTSIKPFPSCRCTHTPVGELLELRARHGIEGSAIEHVTIATFGHSIEVSHRPEVRSKFDAILSHQYCAALALAKGSLGSPTSPRSGSPIRRYAISSRGSRSFTTRSSTRSSRHLRPIVLRSASKTAAS